MPAPTDALPVPATIGELVRDRLEPLRHAEPGTLGGVQRDQQGAHQGADGDGDQRRPEGQPDRDDDSAHDDVEHVDVAAQPEGELVPGLAVPRPSRDVVDVPVLDVPGQLDVPCRGYSHLWSPFP
jgi:hypothetical protein